MSEPLDVSKDAVIEFTFDGLPATGHVVWSCSDPAGGFVQVNVETETYIPEGAQLELPGLIAGLGLAHPTERSWGHLVILNIPHAAVNRSTITGR